MKISKRQRDIIDFIKREIELNGYPPSVREIGKAVGLKSSSSVHNHLVKLEEMGFIKRSPLNSRTVVPVEEESLKTPVIALPLVGEVAAGTPILAQENIETYLPVPEHFAGQGIYFILKTRGDSMIEAGILDGDYLIVREQPDAANGEIVVAMMEEEATVKRFYRRQDYIELQPENPALEPIRVKEAHIIGKVTGLLRKM